MFVITVKTTFSAAHQLRRYPGNCKRIHGHNWTIKACVSTKDLDSIGIGFDFRNLKQALTEIVEQYDHQLINEIPPFDQLNPTSENLAQHIFYSLKKTLPPHVKVFSVEVVESENCSVTYYED